MNRPVHFEIPATDPDKIMAFFKSVFGWSFQKWDGPMPYWMAVTGPNDQPGINGGVMLRHHPEQPMANTIDVVDLDACVASVLANGGAIALAKMPVPGVGWLAYFKDPEGNIHGVMQTDPNAR